MPLQWTFDMEEKLIAAIFARPAIWDKTNPGNSSNVVLSNAWDAVVAKMDVKKGQAKSKWRTMCLTFQRELSRLPQASRWPHFVKMKFLSDNNGNTVDNNPKLHRKVPSDTSSTLSVPQAPTGKPAVKPADEHSSMSLLEGDDLFFKSLLPYLSTIKCPQRKLQFRTAFDILLMQFLEKSCISTDQKDQKEDSDENDCQVVDFRINKGPNSTASTRSAAKKRAMGSSQEFNKLLQIHVKKEKQ